MSTIPNSLSKAFPRISLQQGRMRAGLQTGLSSGELAAGKSFRTRMRFQTWGADSQGTRVDKNDSFISGEVYRDAPDAPASGGWRRDFSLGLCDDDQHNNLNVVLEKNLNSSADLVVSNPGSSGNSVLRIGLDNLDSIEPGTRVLSGEETRVVFVQSEVSDRTGERRTRVGIGTWAPDATWYEVSNGTLRMCSPE